MAQIALGSIFAAAAAIWVALSIPNVSLLQVLAIVAVFIGGFNVGSGSKK